MKLPNLCNQFVPYVISFWEYQFCPWVLWAGLRKDAKQTFLAASHCVGTVHLNPRAGGTGCKWPGFSPGRNRRWHLYHKKTRFSIREMSWEMNIASENQFLFSLHDVSEQQNIRGPCFVAAHTVTVENPDKVGSRWSGLGLPIRGKKLNQTMDPQPGLWASWQQVGRSWASGEGRLTFAPHRPAGLCPE